MTTSDSSSPATDNASAPPVAIVTGGGTGVGRATALQLAARGYRLVINYSRSQTEAEATAAEIQSLGGHVQCLQADVSSDADCRRLADAALQIGRAHV